LISELVAERLELPNSGRSCSGVQSGCLGSWRQFSHPQREAITSVSRGPKKKFESKGMNSKRESCIVRGAVISDGRRTLRRFEPCKGEGLGPGSSVNKSLREIKAKRGALA